MEPQHNNYGQLTELPQPLELPRQAMPEQGPPAQPEVSGNKMSNIQPAVQPANPQNGSTQQSLQPVGQPTVGAAPVDNNSTAALIADDADLIEKEWVIKAKSIVMQTKDDPYNQNREMNKIKADYLKKRYNKDLKISET